MGGVIELGGFSKFRPDVGELARRQLASARRRLGMSYAEMATALGAMVNWQVSAQAVERWETDAVPPGDILIAADLLVQRGATDGESLGSAGADALEQLVSERFADVAAVYVSRAAFSSAFPPHVLFDRARDIAATGLSLNLICQQYSDQRLVRLIEGGCRVRCLFLAPNGASIRVREREEEYPPGHLSALTEMNIRIMCRLRDRLSEDARPRLALATYEEPVRFNIVLIDDQFCVVQPYLTGVRGVDSPTLLLRSRQAGDGLFPAFRQAFMWLWDRSLPSC